MIPALTCVCTSIINRSFTLSNKNQYIVNSPAKDGGKAGDYTREAGFLSYYEVCQMLLDGASYIWDDEMKVPYLVKGDQWVSESCMSGHA